MDCTSPGHGHGHLAVNGILDGMFCFECITDPAQDLSDELLWVERRIFSTTAEQMLVIMSSSASGAESGSHLRRRGRPFCLLLGWSRASSRSWSQKPVLALIGNNNMGTRVSDKSDDARLAPARCLVGMLMEIMPAFSELYVVQLNHEVEVGPPFGEVSFDLGWDHAWNIPLGIELGKCRAWR